MLQSRLLGSLFVMRKYRDVVSADQTESGIWVREIDHIHYRKRKLFTLLLRCKSECVTQLKNFEEKNNVVKTL